VKQFFHPCTLFNDFSNSTFPFGFIFITTHVVTDVDNTFPWGAGRVNAPDVLVCEKFRQHT